MLGDGAGKKGSRKGMYNVTRVRYIRAFFYKKVSTRVQGECKNSSSCWKFELLGTGVFRYQQQLSRIKRPLNADSCFECSS